MNKQTRFIKSSPQGINHKQVNKLLCLTPAVIQLQINEIKNHKSTSKNVRKIISIFKQSVNFVNFGELGGADILHFFGIVISMRCQ